MRGIDMTSLIPLIRSGAIVPMRRWLVEIGRDPTPLLAEADLAWVPLDDPTIPIPSVNVTLFLRAIARQEGPDAPYRIINERTPVEVGLIVAVALGGKTLREGFRNAARAMHAHSTHEFITVGERDDALHIGEGWVGTIGDDEVLHLVQQYTAAIVDGICGLAGAPHPHIGRVGMVPHPDVGLAHLRPWLGERAYPSGRRMLDIEIPNAVADLRNPEPLRTGLSDVTAGSWPSLRDDDTPTGAVAMLICAMLPLTRPTVDRFARAAGLSPRTFQRRLREQGVSFSDVVERTLASIALSRLSQPDPPRLKSLAAELGYADPATLTRAVRRWTGQTPRNLKKSRSR
jgi:AraC-like DNA-binding protein